jgi:uncharacterized protein (TIGR02246 family)
MKSNALGVLIIGFLTVGLTHTALADDDADTLQQFKDTAEIEHLMWRYARALDTGDAEAYAAAYTEDGVFTAGATSTKGREALKAMIAGVGQGQPGATPRPQMYHMTANSYLEFVDKDHAKLHAYWITDVAASGDTPSRLAAVGRSVDTLVRTKDGWRIQIRDVAPQD